MRLGIQMGRKTTIIGLCTVLSCGMFCSQNKNSGDIQNKDHPVKQVILPGAYQTDQYIPCLLGKNVAVVVNHTSFIGSTSLVDSLLHSGVTIKRIFSPEHGYRGTAGAGENVHNVTDEKTGLPVISLYGHKYKPAKKEIADIDIIVFDIQDVGVRFYTYISTMHYVMGVCAENDIEFLLLDRPNPNGFYIDGPVLEEQYKSFVGLHPIPVVYGMTLAELAFIINEEGWLDKGVKCKLNYVLCKNYTHDSLYQLPVAPSPNLQNMQAVYLYPSLGLFEGTVMSVARGTKFPFQAYGHPKMQKYDTIFIPKSIENISIHTKYMDQVCHGINLRNYNTNLIISQKRIILKWLMHAYENTPQKDFFNTFFYNLSGSSSLVDQIKKGMTEEEIRACWDKEIQLFKEKRKKYLLYEDYY